MRSTRRLPRLAASIVKSKALTPGRASGVSSGPSSRSMAASTLQAMTEVAKPVSLTAASRAHAELTAVTTTRAAHIENASANVSWMWTPRISTSALRQQRTRLIAQTRHRVILEGDGPVQLHVASHTDCHRRIVRGLHVQPVSRRRTTQLAFLNDKHAALDHKARRRKHPRHVGI